MRIICLHQSADLYGSDRSFLQVVEFFKSSGKYSAITVILPRYGPLSDELAKLSVEVIYMNLSLLSKTYLKSLQWGKIFFPLLNFRNKKLLIDKYDVLYANTSVILDFYALAPFVKARKFIHIREIPANWLGKILSVLISRSRAFVIFNSHSTKSSFAEFKQSAVIHNAFEGYPSETVQQTEYSKLQTEPLNILLIGRINSWKGQDFTIEALSKISKENFKLRIVGSPAAGNENLLSALKAKVKSLDLFSKVEFIEFASHPASEYQRADLIIVPSIKPEPFGRIAIEAMSLGKPVIAANHGGLPEIIEHNKSGFLFNPGDVDSFNSYLSKYLFDKQLLADHGKNSKILFEDKFSVGIMHKKLKEVFF